MCSVELGSLVKGKNERLWQSQCCISCSYLLLQSSISLFFLVYSSNDIVAGLPYKNRNVVFRNRDASPISDSAATVVSRAKHLHLLISQNLTITENCLKNFNGLENLDLHLYPLAYYRNGPWLNIVPTAFRGKTKLAKIRMAESFSLTRNTIQALESVKDQIQDLRLSKCRPAQDLVPVVGKFSKLKSLYLRFDQPVECPENLLKASAGTLENVTIASCISTEKLPKVMFKNMGKLENLCLVQNNVPSIEQGAFDDLVSLKRLYFIDNKTKQLPDGLFNKTRNIELVDFSENSVKYLSASNFTGYEKFQKLCLVEKCPLVKDFTAA